MRLTYRAIFIILKSKIVSFIIIITVFFFFYLLFVALDFALILMLSCIWAYRITLPLCFTLSASAVMYALPVLDKLN